MADVADQSAVPVMAEPSPSERMRTRQAEAQKRQIAMEERKHADAMEEYRLRFAAQKKDVEVLPVGSVIEEKVKSMAEEVELLCKEIEFNEPDQGHSEHVKEALDALIKNYRGGLARFKALPFLDNEDMLMTCVGDLMECKTECREIIEDLDQLFDLVYVKQSLHVWYQEIKRDMENLYHMRTTRDLLFRTWLRGFVERDEAKEKEGGLQRIIQDAFVAEGLEMPADYRIKSKEEREKEYEEELKRREAMMEERMKLEEEQAKKDEEAKAGEQNKDAEKKDEVKADDVKDDVKETKDVDMTDAEVKA
ncbi:hypothetical protein QFC20_006359 [Naganishia adeliensis]|uniref:Uncharacterized protein n=1 Tax=Naganishia adeliensis TaxID=92952 RepID=A0ACC2VBZ8_9TREE|nr:hypothetical protein QFC20_006359 [Naganishia adeliensis]